METLTGLVRRCVEDYDMIQNGEIISIGLSGGKDSTALLCALANLREYYPEKFELRAITLSAGFPGMDFSELGELCRRLRVPHTILETDIREIVFDIRKEKNPCSLCSKMRRGALASELRRQGISKIALGHHFDDAAGTFLMSLLFEGRIGCFRPVTYLDRTGITQIRPMLYVGEGMIKRVVERYKLPVVKSTCPMDGTSKRREVKDLISGLEEKYPDLKAKVFGAMQRYPLDGWDVPELKRRPMPE